MKKYKVRVEVDTVLEIEVEADHEDEAAAIAEEIANDKLYYRNDIVLGLSLPDGDRDENIWVPNYGVTAIEIEEMEE